MKTRRFPIQKEYLQKAQSMVEMAITMSIIITLLSGAFDFGTAFFYFISMRDAAQEGAIYGSIAPYIDANGNGAYDEGEINQAIITRVRFSPSPLDLSRHEVVVKAELNPTACAGGWIKVEVTYDYPISMPFLGAILGSNSIPLHAQVFNTLLSPECPATP